MKTAAIIAEFDPFHRGHQYLVNQAREKYQAEHVIVIMSGCFVQRGMPASLPPSLRTRMALLGGADLVLQLPVYGSLGSAEVFAESAVSILDHLGIADMLCFGCEDNVLAHMQRIAFELNHESEAFRDSLHQFIRQGYSFPAARSRALSDVMENPAVSVLLSKPNNILAIEYIRALQRINSRMVPCPVSRIGDGHHAQSISGDHPASATAIRKAIKDMVPEEIKKMEALPQGCAALIAEYMTVSGMLSLEDFSEMIAFSLTQNAGHLTDYGDITDDLSRRFLTGLASYRNADDFVDLIHAKSITDARIRRSLCCVLLGLRKPLMKKWQDQGYQGYVNVLGMRGSGRSLIGQIPKQVRRTMILRPHDLSHLDQTGHLLSEADALAGSLYDRMCMMRYGFQNPVPMWKTLVLR